MILFLSFFKWSIMRINSLNQLLIDLIKESICRFIKYDVCLLNHLERFSLRFQWMFYDCVIIYCSRKIKRTLNPFDLDISNKYPNILSKRYILLIFLWFFGKIFKNLSQIRLYIAIPIAIYIVAVLA